MASPYRDYTRPIFITGMDDDNFLTESECSGRWGDEEWDGKERAPLSPVSEDPCEMMNDDEAMIYDIIEGGVPAPPDGGWGWVIVFASFCCNLIVDGLAYSFGVFLVKFAETFNEGPSKVAWVGSLLCGMYLLVGPFVSALTNKFGCRVVCIVGSIVGSLGFALSSFSQSLEVLMLTYGVIGGIGFGLIYLPAVVCVGYYFESKRALATGLAVCGSGVGTFIFAPFSAWLLEITDWRNANLVFSGLIFSCAIFGALMRPLEVERNELEDDDREDLEQGRNGKPLLQRMADDKRNYLEKGSLAGSAYFMVQLPDGTKEKRMKLPLNVDPGVHSSFNLDQLVPGTGTSAPNTALPTITEAKTMDGGSVGGSDGSHHSSSGELKSPSSETKDKHSEDQNTIKDERFHASLSTTPAIPIPIPASIVEESENDTTFDSPSGKSPLSASVISANRRSLRERRNSDGLYSSSPTNAKQAELFAKSPPRTISIKPVPSFGSRVGGIPRNGSAPQFNAGRSIPKNVSVPFFDRMPRRHSYRAVPIGSVPRPSSKTNLQENRRGSNQFKTSLTSFVSSKNNNIGSTQEDDYNSLWSKGELSEGLIFSTSQRSQQEPRHIIRPFSRKDIFYSGSIAQLPEFQSQKSLTSYRQSVLNIPRLSGAAPDEPDGPISPEKSKPIVCPCLLYRAGAFKSALSQLMDFSLLKNPIFLFIAISNIFGMLGFYVPFVYIIDSAMKKGVDKEQAAFLLSIIGITNTIGRVACGLLSDLPQVNSLFMNNMCILLSGICVAVVPFCPNYFTYVGVAVFFGLFVSGYVSLTSIILVDLLGLENLTNAFGLLILFRGGASIVGAPLAGAVFEAFQSYDIPFYLAGSFLVFSALISFMIPFVKRFAPPKPLLEPRTFYGGQLEDIPEDAESVLNIDEETEYDQVESRV